MERDYTIMFAMQQTGQGTYGWPQLRKKLNDEHAVNGGEKDAQVGAGLEGLKGSSATADLAVQALRD